jgi:pimeloyl-ACP methyl ester carboxylesterase
MPSNEPDTVNAEETRSPAGRHENIGARLAYSRLGAGQPLVLLHGHGLSRRSWDPVVTELARERDVIAVDLPGHGDSPRQPRGAGNTPLDLARAVAELLDQLGLASVHVAGNSVGGWVALELGRLQRATTVTALSPGGLWGRHAPIVIGATMRQSRINARIVRRLAPNAPRSRLARALFMAQLSGHPSKVSYAMANRAIHDMATAPGFRETLHAAEGTGFRDGAAIRVPVTVAFGARDRVMPPVLARRRRELPPQTQWMEIKSAGHVPMFDQPGPVVALLLHASGPRAGERIR